MIQPRYSRLSCRSQRDMFRPRFPTGKGFGGSSLKITQSEELVFSIVSESVSISDYAAPVCDKPAAPFVIEVGKIVAIAIWFWCLIGANFCFNSVSTISRHMAQDI